jgi:hypothetical protein
VSATLWRLPWTLANVPHALLDVLRGCNIRCRACYNRPGTELRSLEELRVATDALLARRPLSSVGIIGGEPLLHPELDAVVRDLRGRDLHVELFTNGVLLDEQRAARLAEAGLSMAFMHVDQGQERPDLPSPHGAAERRALLEEKAALLERHGIEAGLAVTGYEADSELTLEAVRAVLEIPNLNYLLVTLHREHQPDSHFEGDLEAGLQRVSGASQAAPAGIMQRWRERVTEAFGITPFAGVGSSVDPDDWRWISWNVAVLHDGERRPEARVALGPSLLERAFLAVTRWLKGCYPFYVPQDGRRLRSQLLLNGLLTGNRGARALWRASAGRAEGLSTKRLLLQNPAELLPDGRVAHCACCPDAVLRGGELVPVCICDLHRAQGG